MHLTNSITNFNGKTLIMEATSIAANRNMELSGKKITHSDKILQALRKIRQGNFERIAYFAGMTEASVWKRLSEMERAGKIRKTGKTSVLSSGDKGVIWEIIETPTANIQKSLFE